MLLCVLLLCLYIHSSTSCHFGYTLEDQKNWHKLNESYEKCSFGSYQAPVHIEQHHVESIVMPSLDFIGYDNFLATPLKLENDGHTVTLMPGEYSNNSLYQRPSISGALLPTSYIFHGLHFHWGEENHEGSEHVLNHVRHPMEMHVVHWNAKYGSIDEATRFKDGLAVLAVFFSARVADNGKLRPIINRLRHLAECHSETSTNKSFSLSSILPKHRQTFFTYEGSMTTPPCHESVTWFIFPRTIPISFTQMEGFRKLGINKNYRHVQPVGQRRIYLRNSESYKTSFREEIDRNTVARRSFWLH